MESLRVLFIEDSEDDALLLVEALRKGGFAPYYQRVETAADFRAALAADSWELIIADYSLPHFSGMAALHLLQELAFDLPFIMVSGKVGEETAVEAMRAGAQDYLLKDQLARLAPAITRELQEAKVRRERREIEEERTRMCTLAEQRYAELDATINSIADGLIIFNQQGQITRLNAIAERMLGCSPSEQPPAFQAVIADGIPVSSAELPSTRALRGEAVFGQVLEIRRLHGTLWVSASAAPICTEDGVFLGAVLSLTDITALRELQQQQETILHTVSHDLRVPLTVIYGHADIMQDEMDEQEIHGDLRKSLDTIRRSGQRMNAMIQDLVDAARMEGGQLQLTTHPVELAFYLPDFLRRTATALAVQRVNLQLTPGIPPVFADYDRLDRILTNLISNALKYSTPDAAVVVTARQQEGKVLISVQDAGQGIAPDDQQHIFERFYRASGGRKVDSIGLGLYISKMLVEAHGGQIWVESTPGEGSIFYFTLPIAT